MRRLAFVATLVACCTVIASADRYSVTVKRIEKDLYQVVGAKLIVETRYCFQYTYGDDAILNWEGPYGDNWLLFINAETKCSVIALR